MKIITFLKIIFFLCLFQALFLGNAYSASTTVLHHSLVIQNDSITGNEEITFKLCKKASLTCTDIVIDPNRLILTLDEPVMIDNLAFGNYQLSVVSLKQSGLIKTFTASKYDFSITHINAVANLSISPVIEYLSPDNFHIVLNAYTGAVGSDTYASSVLLANIIGQVTPFAYAIYKCSEKHILLNIGCDLYSTHSSPVLSMAFAAGKIYTGQADGIMDICAPDNKITPCQQLNNLGKEIRTIKYHNGKLYVSAGSKILECHPTKIHSCFDIYPNTDIKQTAQIGTFTIVDNTIFFAVNDPTILPKPPTRIKRCTLPRYAPGSRSAKLKMTDCVELFTPILGGGDIVSMLWSQDRLIFGRRNRLMVCNSPLANSANCSPLVYGRKIPGELFDLVTITPGIIIPGFGTDLDDVYAFDHLIEVEKRTPFFTPDIRVYSIAVNKGTSDLPKLTNLSSCAPSEMLSGTIVDTTCYVEQPADEYGIYAQINAPYLDATTNTMQNDRIIYLKQNGQLMSFKPSFSKNGKSTISDIKLPMGVVGVPFPDTSHTIDAIALLFVP
jgi:hypothetical protein